LSIDGKQGVNMIRYTSTTVTLGHCDHLNGWYSTVNFWIFRKRVFVCVDCGDALSGERLRKWEGKI
jgi:hypothetical protein